MNKLFKITKRLILIIIALIVIYGILSFLFSWITVNKEANNKNEITIYILTNGVHTDIVVPAKTAEMDWTQKVKYENTRLKDNTMLYLAMGWGDKGFYLETPNWSDLKASVALKAAFGINTTAIHTTYYASMKEGKDCKKILISNKQYRRLVNFINKSFKINKNGQFDLINTEANYTLTDAFYEAKGRYSMFYTCNTWANTALKECGQKCCLWTPFDFAIFWKYE